MVNILGIDPGSTKSGWILLEDQIPKQWGWDENHKVAAKVKALSNKTMLAVEYMHPRGQLMSKDALATMFELGRMTASIVDQKDIHKIDRKDVKMYLLGRANGTDPMIRQTIIDLYGGDAVAIGGRKCPRCKGKGWNGRDHDICTDCHCAQTKVGSSPVIGCGFITHPGPLHGITGQHIWDAFGVALLAHNLPS